MSDVITCMEAFSDIDEDWLYEKSGESDYWQKCFDFYYEMANMNVKNITTKQYNWLEQIQDACRDDT